MHQSDQAGSLKQVEVPFHAACNYPGDLVPQGYLEMSWLCEAGCWAGCSWEQAVLAGSMHVVEPMDSVMFLCIFQLGKAFLMLQR